MTSAYCGLILSLSLAFQVPGFTNSDWVRAEANIVRRKPSEFSSLPPRIIRYLAHRGYRVPQLYSTVHPHNVLKGQFTRRGRTDFAVLASRDGISQILVFWGGSTKRVSRLGRAKDADFLQTTGADSIGYSRAISVVDAQYILKHYEQYGGPKPPRIDHQAIDDAFAEKASSVFYFDGKRWLTLQGAD